MYENRFFDYIIIIIIVNGRVNCVRTVGSWFVTFLQFNIYSCHTTSERP